jgi:hypothetical protein
MLTVKDFPRELKGSVPPIIQELVDIRTVAFVILVMAGVLLYGGTGLKNGWERYAPPVIGSLGMTLLFFVRPWNPYKSYWAKRRRMGEADVEHQIAAERLIRVMRSKGAKRVALYAGLGTAAILEVLTLLIGSLRTPPREWSVALDKVLIASFIWSGIAIYPIIFCLLRWSIRMWMLEDSQLNNDC